jgi:Tfp pilus assembly protein PilN
VKLFQTVLGVDPSGGRLAAVAVQRGLGGPVVARPPLCHEYRGDRGATRLEEAEIVLGEYVARNGLVGAEAFLALPADQVHMARAVFPPLRERDLREAVGLELERLFPVVPATLRYGYRVLPDTSPKGKISLVVAAVSVEYLDRCEEVLTSAGLSSGAAIPAGWAAGAAMSRIESQPPRGATSVLLRWLGDSVECTVFAQRETLFSAVRPCAPEEAAAEGISLALAGLTDAPARGEGEPVVLYAPAGWLGPGTIRPGDPETPFVPAGEFAERAVPALKGETGPDSFDPYPLLCSYGAAIAGRELDLLNPQRTGAISRAAWTALGASAAVAIVLGISWPATAAWRASSDIRRLDAKVAALRPFAQQFEESLSDLDDARARAAILQGEASASGETLQIMKELTDRLPNGTWLASLRLEGRKMDLEGFSPSASEIFAVLTRDGRFKSVEFGAPITRQADNIERFKIRGEYVPPPAQGPPAAAPARGAAR